jgi:hypothetical protein
MGYDEERRAKERESQKAGGVTALDEARSAHAATRAGDSLVSFIAGFIGQWVYIEGVKLNYRGVLQDVTVDGSGRPSSLLMNPCARTGEWNDFPKDEYEETMNGTRALPWDTVCDFGAMQAHWPKAVPPPGPMSQRKKSSS